MYTGLVVTGIIFCFSLFFIIYKRDMLARLFSLNAAEPANRFQIELEQTANAVVDRLETQMAHLEYLLEEADNRIEMLTRQVQAADRLLKNMAPTTPQLLFERPIGITDGEEGIASSNAGKSDSSGKNRRQVIIEMSEQGYNVTEIAKATGMGKGEIMLLLQLNKK